MSNNKKTILLALAIIFAIIASVISFNKKDINTIIDEENKEEKQKEGIKKDFKIELENSKCNYKWKTIYEYYDGKKIKSKCGEVYYIENNSDKITLKEAIDKQYITIKDITDNMEVIWGAFDGGSTLFGYDVENNTISDARFNLEVCKVISGNKNQLFISSNDKKNYCS